MPGPDDHGYGLIRCLADGNCHSALELALELGIREEEVLGALATLTEAGLRLKQTQADGFQLTQPLELLQARRIEEGLTQESRRLIQTVDVLEQVDSTNAWLQGQAKCDPGHGRACLAELQTAGRGRRGRKWLAPPGGSLCLSVSWHFPANLSDMSGLSLVCGVAVVRALEGLGVENLGLKWPNDLTWDGRKLGGLLVEMRSSGSGAVYVVVGLGLNLNLGAYAEEIVGGWGGEPVDLASILPGGMPGRNMLAAALLNALANVLEEFSRLGFSALRPEWERLDCLRGRTVNVHGEDWTLRGTALGVDAAGALRLVVDGKVIDCVAGEVSVRLENATAD
ncbi:MAG: biotin--[acetyl-CoA-carboxylase] ligase [Gammaproteobacteria bacterium]|jgi:BirA family biotin operon repressor/biotin-[acetyl-CoA-carboxylase] ligase|nr:biotin--[acetyl-CoA-carboxylase] ligase [Gammaproteobacteria bacterium]